MSPDQRYCLSCGARRGAPRVAPATPRRRRRRATRRSRRSSGPADVSPLAAVIGIALLGGMLLIGVLIGRSGSDDNSTPAPIVQVDPGQTTPGGPRRRTTHHDRRPRRRPASTRPIGRPTPRASRSSSAWSPRRAPPRTSSTPRRNRRPPTAPTTSARSTPTSIRASTPGNYVIYSGIYTDREPGRPGARQARQGLPRRDRDRGQARGAAAGTQGPGAAVDRRGRRRRGRGLELSPAGSIASGRR